MISINSTSFINGLRSIGSELQTQIKNLSTFLSKLNCVTNAGAHSGEAQTLFRDGTRSTNQSAKSTHSQYSAPLKQTEQGSDKMKNLTGKRQAPQPPQGLATTLKPMLKELQLRLDMADARKPIVTHTRRPQATSVPSPVKKQQAPLPPLSSIARQQAPAGVACYERHNITADHSPKIRRVPMPSLSPELTAELEPMVRDSGLRIRHDSMGLIPTKARHSLPPSVPMPKPMTVNNKQSAGNTIISSEKQQLLLSPAQEALAEKLRMALNDFHLNPEAAKEKWISAGR